MPACARPPIGEVGVRVVSPTLGPGSAQYAAGSRGRCRLPSPSHCHSLCPDTDAARIPLRSVVAPARSHRWSHPATARPARSLQPPPRRAVHHLLRRLASVSPHFWHGQWDWGRSGPPFSGLPHSRVGRLPLPVTPVQILAPLLDHCPDSREDAAFDPALEGAVDGGVIRIVGRQMVPLATSA